MRHHDGTDPTIPFDTISDESFTGPSGRPDARAFARQPGLSVAQEGVRAGVLAAAAVAIALALADIHFGEPLMTPALIGYGVERALGFHALADALPAVLAGGTALQLGASVAVATIAAALVRRVRREVVLLPALLLLVVVAALGLIAVGMVVARTDGLIAGAVPRFIGANVLGWLFAAGRLWVARAGVRVAPANDRRGAERLGRHQRPAELRPTH